MTQSYFMTISQLLNQSQFKNNLFSRQAFFLFLPGSF